MGDEAMPAAVPAATRPKQDTLSLMVAACDSEARRIETVQRVLVEAGVRTIVCADQIARAALFHKAAQSLSLMKSVEPEFLALLQRKGHRRAR